MISVCEYVSWMAAITQFSVSRERQSLDRLASGRTDQKGHTEKTFYIRVPKVEYNFNASA